MSLSEQQWIKQSRVLKLWQTVCNWMFWACRFPGRNDELRPPGFMTLLQTYRQKKSLSPYRSKKHQYSSQICHIPSVCSLYFFRNILWCIYSGCLNTGIYVLMLILFLFRGKLTHGNRNILILFNQISLFLLLFLKR